MIKWNPAKSEDNSVQPCFGSTPPEPVLCTVPLKLNLLRRKPGSGVNLRRHISSFSGTARSLTVNFDKCKGGQYRLAEESAGEGEAVTTEAWSGVLANAQIHGIQSFRRKTRNDRDSQ